MLAIRREDVDVAGGIVGPTIRGMGAQIVYRSPITVAKYIGDQEHFDQVVANAVEVYAAGPKLVVVINDAERLELNCLDAAAIKTVDGDRRYECGQVMVHRVDNLTIQVSNSLDQACAFRVRANQNTLMIETTKGSYVFKEGQKTTVYVS